MTVRTLAAAIVCVTATSAAFLASEPRAESAARMRSGYALAGTCGPYPKVRISMLPGYCAGLVAAKEDGLDFPRSIVQVPASRFFVVVDMVGWQDPGLPGKGRIWLLDPQAAEGKRLKQIIKGLDHPHGLGVGIDRKIYASTVETIFRFDPLAPNPDATREVIIRGLPGRQPTLPDGTKIKNNLHPLRHFIFGRNGRLYVNIGAPSDRCATKATETKACNEGEGDFASIWAFTPPTGGIFPELKGDAPKETEPKPEVYARGLRNSMALAIHPRFPDAGYPFLQGENALDLKPEDRPSEEINVVERGKHYGWPYCYDLSAVLPPYAAFLKTNSPYRNLCSNNPIYRRPHSLLAPHGAPLAMFYYGADKFPALKGKLIVGLHGHKPTGSRVLAYDVDAKGLPVVSPPPVRYSVSCATPPTRVFGTDAEKQVPAAQATELIYGWHTVQGVRPRGAPVGMTVADDGAIWLVEDRNKTILRIDTERPDDAVGALSCDTRDVNAIVAAVMKDSANKKRLSEVRAGLFKPHCRGCHSDIGISPNMSDAKEDEAALRYILEQDGWVLPGNLAASRLHMRVWGKGPEMIMPKNGNELLKQAPYQKILKALDQLITTMPKK